MFLPVWLPLSWPHPAVRGRHLARVSQVGRTLGPLLMLVLGTLSLCTVTDLIAVIAIFKRGRA